MPKTTEQESRKILNKYLTEAAKDSAKDIGNVIGKHSSEVLGSEMSEAFQDVKNITGSLVNFGKSLFGVGKKEDKSAKIVKDTKDSISNIEKGNACICSSDEILYNKIDDLSQKMTTPLEGLYDIQKDREKRAARKIDKKEVCKNWVLPIVAGIGLILGGLARKFILPFEVIWSGLLQIGKFFGSIGKWMTKIPGVQKFIEMGIIGITKIGNFFRSIAKIPKIQKFIEMGIIGITKIGNFFRSIGGFISKIKGGISSIIDISSKFTNVLMKVPIIGTLFKGILKGFTKLGGPIQIVFSLIDFIKGFTKTEGGLVKKIIGGLKSVVMGFLDLPLRVLGWITDKVLGIFGVEIEGGVGNFLIEKTKSFLNLPEKAISWITDKILGFFSSEIEGNTWNFLKEKTLQFLNLPSKVMGWIGDKILGLFNSELAGNVWNFLKEKTLQFLNIPGTIMNVLRTKISELFNSELAGNVWNFLKEKALSLFNFPGMAIGFITDKISGLFAGGKEGVDLPIKEAIESITSVISNIFSAIKKFFSFGKIISWMKNIFEEKSPEEMRTEKEREEDFRGVKNISCDKIFANQIIPVEESKLKEMETEKSRQMEMARRGAEKREEIEKKRNEEIKAMKSVSKVMETKEDKTNQLQIINSNAQQAVTPSESSEIPSDIDNHLLGFAVGGLI